MRFEWFIAKRYLRSPNRPAVLRLVTAFSVVGVMAGVPPWHCVIVKYLESVHDGEKVEIWQ
jgi:ABC-type lipoprotein release transport system permease subunit